MTNDPPTSANAGATFPKRFYQAATTAPVQDGVALLLDGRPARTPGRNGVTVPNRRLAEALAAEWNAVAAVIDPRAMPMTRLVNSVIDGVSTTGEAVLDEIRRYAESDLLVYRAEAPAELVATQVTVWDPVLAWARDTLGVDLLAGPGVMFVHQSPEALEQVGVALRHAVGFGPAASYRLGALHVMTTLTGSCLLALAVAARRLRDDEAWAAAHVDEDHQISAWGTDGEATARRAGRWTEMQTAAHLYDLVREA